MFLEYYGLREQPFGVTPDPRYLYFSAMHREALASLFYGIETGCGFMTLIAPPGMGKTTLLLHLLERLRKSARTVFLFQTQCDPREFFRYLLTDLGVDASNQNMAYMHEALNSVLLSNARMGRRFVLIIDEAQNLKRTVLETVRLLSDFETPAAKLMQIVLSGQPQLADRLSHPALMQLRQRISIVSRLHPFTRVEMMVYIHHRLNVAGYSGPPLFNYDAVDQIAVHSGGVPRNINNICFNALTLGYAKGQKQINGSIVREVLADLDIDALSSRSVVPAFATQDSSSSVDRLEPTDEATYQDFQATARTAWAKGIEGGGAKGHAESDPIPTAPGEEGNPPTAGSQRDSSAPRVAESPLGQKPASVEEIVASIGSLQASPAESLRPTAVIAAAPGSSVEPSWSEQKEPPTEDETPAPQSLAQPTATSQDPSFASLGSQEHVQAVAPDSPLAHDAPKTEIPEQSCAPTKSLTETSHATSGSGADTRTPSLACSTTREPFDSQSGIGAHKGQDSEPQKRWELIAVCGAVLFVAGVGGVPLLHRAPVGDVGDPTQALAAQPIPRSNPAAHVDPASRNFKTVGANPAKDATPSVRAQHQQSATMKQSIPNVTSDMFGALNAHPVSTRPAAAAQAATASSLDAGLVFSDEHDALLGITSSSDSDAAVLPPPAYTQDGLPLVGRQMENPEPLSRPLPEYPQVARQWHVEGNVVVDILVDENGNVSNMNVVSGPMILRRAALDALRGWKYKPFRLAGQPTAVRMRVTIRFHLP